MKFQKSRMELCRGEIPTWTQRPVLPGDPEAESSVQAATSRSTPTSQKRKRNPNRDNRVEQRVLNVSDQFPLASYRRPAAGQILGIIGQPDNLRSLLTYTVRHVIKYAILVNTYIEMKKAHPTLCGIFMLTVHKLKQQVYADWMEEDKQFQKDVAGMVSPLRSCELVLIFLVL
jgi:hypothetical protein